jgi:alpha-D-ribose 1-methylphosphonate 5-triphosphate diphosphatase PhnM
LGTGRVARAFPEMASDRGVLQKGLRGDITIADSHNLGRVRHVLVKGKLVVFNGALRR